MRFIQRLVTPSLVLLVAFSPLLTEVAKADTGSVMVAQTDIAAANTNSASASGGGVQSGHFELFQDLNGGETLHADVTDGAQTASVDFDGSTMLLGDGYTLKAETESNTATTSITKVFVAAPDHRHATGTLRLDKQTQQVTATNMAAVQTIAQESGSLGVLNSALPVLVAISKSQSSGGSGSLRAASNSIACIAAWIAYAAEMAALILACGIPEPVEPLACALAVGTFAYAGVELGEACSRN